LPPIEEKAGEGYSTGILEGWNNGIRFPFRVAECGIVSPKFLPTVREAKPEI
jgi:hypothetical protein